MRTENSSKHVGSENEYRLIFLEFLALFVTFCVMSPHSPRVVLKLYVSEIKCVHFPLILFRDSV